MATLDTSSAPATTAPGTINTFDFPREYHFPPFFTRQPNLTTHHSQLCTWSALILKYCAHHSLYKLSLSSPTTEELFHNKKLNRRLSPADAREVLDFMRKEGRAEPVSVAAGDEDTSDVFWIYWKTPEEWAREVENWVDETAQKGTVLTLWELTDGENSRGAGKSVTIRVYI
jgi:ESCRT-II complex subunit VPS25